MFAAMQEALLGAFQVQFFRPADALDIVAEKQEAQERLLGAIHNDVTQPVAVLKDSIQGYLQDNANQDKLDAADPDLMEIDTCALVPNYLLDVQTNIKNGTILLAPLILHIETPESSVFSQFPRHLSWRPSKNIRRLLAEVGPHSRIPDISRAASAVSSIHCKLSRDRCGRTQSSVFFWRVHPTHLTRKHRSCLSKLFPSPAPRASHHTNRECGNWRRRR